MDRGCSVPAGVALPQLLRMLALSLPVSRRWRSGSISFKSRMTRLVEAILGVPLWIRHVLVPGLTDDEDGLRRTADFIRSLGRCGSDQWGSAGVALHLQQRRGVVSRVPVRPLNHNLLV